MNRFGFFYTPIYMDRITHNNKVSYVVEKGDSLYKIAKKYNVSLDELISYNDLKGSLIYPGQIIVIPIKGMNGATYFEEYMTVDGESIDLISNKLGIGLNDIIQYNDISKLILKENQVINIPGEYKKHEVVATDSVDYLLRKYNMTLEELVNANKDEWLKIGNIINVK